MASRLESHGVPNRVHVTDATLRLVRDRYDAEPLGSVELKGYGPIETYAIAAPRG
jgi:class 3 adenylate cyclase